MSYYSQTLDALLQSREIIMSSYDNEIDSLNEALEVFEDQKDKNGNIVAISCVVMRGARK